jgi:hypothetical protein
MVKGEFPEFSFGGAVRVSVPASVARDLDVMAKVTKEVLGRLGCPNCHSGFDIRFDIEREFFVNLEGKVRGIGER